jgi:hypothetical protein
MDATKRTRRWKLATLDKPCEQCGVEMKGVTSKKRFCTACKTNRTLQDYLERKRQLYGNPFLCIGCERHVPNFYLRKINGVEMCDKCFEEVKARLSESHNVAAN